MKKKPEYNVGDTVYYLYDNRLRKGDVSSVTAHYVAFDDNWFEYRVDNIKIDECDIFPTKSVATQKVLYQLDLGKDKIDFICKTLFPEEYGLSEEYQDQNDLTEEDFEKLDKPKEVLQIEEKTSFWKSLFN